MTKYVVKDNMTGELVSRKYDNATSAILAKYAAEDTNPETYTGRYEVVQVDEKENGHGSE